MNENCSKPEFALRSTHLVPKCFESEGQRRKYDRPQAELTLEQKVVSPSKCEQLGKGPVQTETPVS